jgi:hypothetical protein
MTMAADRTVHPVSTPPTASVGPDELRSVLDGIVARTRMPFTTLQNVSSVSAVCSAPYVDLAKVVEALGATHPPLVQLYADVLDAGLGARWRLTGSVLFVVAREIIGTGPLAIEIDFGASAGASLVVFADAVEGPDPGGRHIPRGIGDFA